VTVKLYNTKSAWHPWIVPFANGLSYVFVYLEATSHIWTLLMRDVQLNSNSNMKFTWEKRGSWEKHWSMNQNGSVTVVMTRDDKPFFFQRLTFVWERNTG